MVNQEEVLLPNTSLIRTIGVYNSTNSKPVLKTKEQKLMVNSVEGCRQLEQRNITVGCKQQIVV